MPPTTWLISTIEYPTFIVSDDGVLIAPGFDLDGVDDGSGNTSIEADCRAIWADARSSIFDRPGVDNNFALMRAVEVVNAHGLRLEPTVQQQLASAPAEGRLLLAIHIEGLPSCGEGTAQLTLLSVREGGDLSDGSGRPAADQVIRADTIVSGVAEVQGPFVEMRVAPVALPVAGEPLPFLPFDEFALTALGIRFDEGVETIRGSFGGSFSAARLLEEGVAFAGEDWRAALEVEATSLADIEPMPSNELFCVRVSAGFDFVAVRATLLP